jgi:hypothetical protein
MDRRSWLQVVHRDGARLTLSDGNSRLNAMEETKDLKNITKTLFTGVPFHAQSYS